MKILWGDFETRSNVDLKKCGADIYARDLSTQVMAFGYAFDEEPVEVIKLGGLPTQRIRDHVASGGAFVAHNATFEWLIWNYAWRRVDPTIPPLNISQVECTMVRAYSMGLPGALEKAAPAAGIEKQKDMKGNRVMLQLSKPKDILNGQTIWWDPVEHKEKFDRMYSYCAMDVEIERELYKRLRPISKSERILWELDHKINQRGICVDVLASKTAVEIVEIESERLDSEMRKVTNNGVGTCSSVGQLTDWLKFRGCKVEGVAKSDVTDLLERKTLPEDCRLALNIRAEAGKSSTKKLQTLIDRTSLDGRMRSTLQFYGAGTGRWAGRGFQLHNLPRQKLEEYEINGVFGVLREERKISGV